MNLKEKIEKALTAQRWETARRLAVDALKEDCEHDVDVTLMLHEAYRHLGNYFDALECLKSIIASSEYKKFDVTLLIGEDYYLLANEGHFRSSAEAKAGLCIDEYLDKYRALSAEAFKNAASLAETDEQKQELDKIKNKFSKKNLSKREKTEFDNLPSSGKCKIDGVLRYPDGKVASGLKLVLGLEVAKVEPEPASYNEAEMHCRFDMGEQRSVETYSDENGLFCFSNLPAGHHEFLAVCLNPLTDEIGTHFLAHDLIVSEGCDLSLELVVKPWQSAEPVDVNNPFEDSKVIDGAVFECCHVEELNNPFYYDFPRQVISFELSDELVDKKACLKLFCSEDVDTVIPFQINNNRISFFAELPPVSNRVYALFCSSDTIAESVYDCGLNLVVASDKESATLSTGRVDYRIAWGNGCTSKPPIIAVRGEDNCWRGSGRWVLPNGVSIVGIDSRVIEQGNISIKVALKYELSNGTFYEIHLTAQEHEAMLIVHEICPDISEMFFEFSLSEFSGGRGFLHWTPEDSSVHWSDLSAEDKELARLQESVAWWIPPEGFGYAMTDGSISSQDYIGVVSLQRGEWVDRQFEKISKGPGDENRELDWPFPEMVGSTISMITAHTTDDGDAFYRFKCFDGERRWGLIVSTFDQNDGPWKEISSLQHKNSSPRLQNLKSWHLDEKDCITRPFVLTQRDKLIGLRTKEKIPYFAKLRKKIADWEAIPSSYDKEQSRGLDAVLLADPIKLWSLKRRILRESHIRSRMTLLGRDYSDMYSPVGGRAITPLAEVYDLIVATGVFSADEERLTRSFLMLMGHMYMEPDFMNWKFNSRNANFEADRVDIVGSVGLAFYGNPDSKIMIDHCATLMKSSLEIYCTPDSGKWYENPACYYLHASTCRLNLVFHLWFHGIFDSTTIERLKDYLSWGLNIASAPYPNDKDVLINGVDDSCKYEAVSKVRQVPPIGDHAGTGKAFSEYYALMSKLYRQKDPDFADRLLGLYQEGGSNGGHVSRFAMFFIAMQEEDLKPIKKLELPSRRLEGFGSVCRGNVGTENEFYLLFKLGPGGYRYHRTEGSILLICDGKPLIFDGGEAGETWRHTTLSFGDTHMPLAPGHIERFHSCSTLDFSQGVNPKALQPGEPVFLSDRCEHQLVDLAFERFNEPNPANSRSVIWVKNEYIVLHDQLNLPEDQLTHWHLQAVADDHAGDYKNGYIFKGRFGTDLQVVLPDQNFDEEQITQQPILEYNVPKDECFSMRHLQLSAIAPKNIVALIRPLNSSKEPVEATLLEKDGKVQGLRVVGDGVDDIHFIDRNGASFEYDGFIFEGCYGSVIRRGDSVELIAVDGEFIKQD